MDDNQRAWLRQMREAAAEIAEELEIGETTAMVLLINMEQLRALQDIRRAVGDVHLSVLGMEGSLALATAVVEDEDDEEPRDEAEALASMADAIHDQRTEGN